MGKSSTNAKKKPLTADKLISILKDVAIILIEIIKLIQQKKTSKSNIGAGACDSRL